MGDNSPKGRGFKSRPVHKINMTKIKAVIFDVGNTLLRYRYKWSGILYKKYKISLPHNEFQKVFKDFYNFHTKNSLNIDIKHFAVKCGKSKDKHFIGDVKKYLGKDHLSYYRFPASISVVKALRNRGYMLAVLSNWHHNCYGILKYHGLASYFQHICVSAKVGITKPNLKIFKIVLKLLNVNAAEALMVGDSYEKDYKPAKKLGMHALLIERKKKKLSHSIRNLRQVLTYIKRIN